MAFSGSGFSIQSTVVRSGNYTAAFTTTTGSPNFLYQFKSSSTDSIAYCRFYFYMTAFPTNVTNIFQIRSVGSIRITSTGTLQLFNASAQVGSDSIVLAKRTWYMIEIGCDTTACAGSDTLTGRLNGTTFATSTSQSLAGFSIIDVGINAPPGSAVTFYFDDIAINDSTGSFQNSYPGEGKIIHLRPNGNGDNSGWLGSDLDSTDNYLLVDEVTPDDATTDVTTAVSGTIDDYEIDATPNLISADDTINVVAVGVRFNNSVSAGTDPTFVTRIKSAAAGTVEESANISATDTTWDTNADAVPRNYALVLYDLPGASTTAWTKSTLDTAQIGIRLTDTPTGLAQISTMWLSVDYTPIERATGVYFPYQSLR